MNKEIIISNKKIGDGNPVFIISEIGSNHNQNINIAKELIDIAADCGADAVKFQLFKADVLYKPGDELYNIFKNIELNSEWLYELKNYSKKKGIIFFASPFDEGSVDELIKIDVPAIKWASSETTNLFLLRYAASKNKPMVISTGMCDIADIHEALHCCYSVGNYNIILLHCRSLYPTKPEDLHLRAMEVLKETFKVPVGFSDHTLGFASAITAVARGAKVIEKHITLNRNSEGPDHFFACEPDDFAEYIKLIRETEICLGNPVVDIHLEEKKVARRNGLYSKYEIRKGDTINEDRIIIKRPALGVKERYLKVVIGKKAKSDIKENSPIYWEDITE